VLGSSGRASCCGIVAQLLGELAQEIVQRGAQIVGELLDLLVAGAALQRLLQRLLRRAQRLVDVGDVAVLDGDGERPQAGDDLAQRIVAARRLELPRRCRGRDSGRLPA
jgi:hypothetical protein